MEVYNNTNTENFTQATESVVSPRKTEAKSFDDDPNFFLWIRNDGLLRDEGVLFGQAQDDPEPKLAVIRQYFKQQSDQLQLKIESNSERLAEINTKKDKLELQMEALQTEHPEDEKELKIAKTSHVAMLIVYALIMFFNFPFLYYYIQPIHTNNAWIITGAVFLFGCLAVFQSNSLLFHANKQSGTDGEEPETWKLWLQEIGIPIVVVIYLWTFIQPAYGYSTAVALCLFQFIFFMLVGKGFKREYQKLNTVHIENEKIKYRNSARDKKNSRNVEDLQIKSNEIKQLESNIEILYKVQSEFKQELAMTEARAETCVKLFLSEFSLARAARKIEMI
jgi:hypothetical protein